MTFVDVDSKQATMHFWDGPMSDIACENVLFKFVSGLGAWTCNRGHVNECNNKDK